MTHRGPFQPQLFCDSVRFGPCQRRCPKRRAWGRSPPPLRTRLQHPPRRAPAELVKGREQQPGIFWHPQQLQ